LIPVRRRTALRHSATFALSLGFFVGYASPDSVK
jgi:hypothetical protein